MTKLILASGSNGRRALLESLKISFEIFESDVDEEKIVSRDPIELAVLRARAKARAVAKRILNLELKIKNSEDVLVLGADTVGFLDDWIFGKPKSRKEAEGMMRRLSGKTHCYVSAHCLIKISNFELKNKNEKKVTSKNDEVGKKDHKIDLLEIVDHDVSFVTFRKLTNEDIKFYLDRVEFLKLCGTFKINDSPQNFVVGTKGSISNIIGLSLEKVVPVLKENGIF